MYLAISLWLHIAICLYIFWSLLIMQYAMLNVAYMIHQLTIHLIIHQG